MMFALLLYFCDDVYSYLRLGEESPAEPSIVYAKLDVCCCGVLFMLNSQTVNVFSAEHLSFKKSSVSL